MRRLLIAAVLAAAALNLNLTAHAQTGSGSWVATWGTAQSSFRAAPAPPPPPSTPGAPAAPAPGPDPRRRHPIPPSIPGLNNQTVRMIVRASVGGDTVRVRLQHAFGAPSVTIGGAHIAVREKDSAIVAGSDRALTFGGRPAATLYGGQTLVSDPVKLTIKPLADLAVSLYLPGETGPPTSHTFGLRPTYISKLGAGNMAAQASLAEAEIERITDSWYWLAGIDVQASPKQGAPAGTLVTFGDSITDGDQSTPDRIAMWPAILAARLQANPSTRNIGVVNAGISGNRLLGDNGSGLARLTLHALSVPGVKWMTLLEGINDITAATRPVTPGSPPPVPLTADDLIAAYKQVIEMAHMHGVKVIGCTLTPYAGSRAYSDAGEAIRQTVNTWIRTSKAFDAVVDFDAVTRDPKQPARLRADADSPDDLHPGDPGYKMMADAIPLTIFR